MNYYEGKFEAGQLKSIAVTDPMYKKNNGVNYYCNKFAPVEHKVRVAIENVTENCEGFNLEYTSFAIAIGVKDFFPSSLTTDSFSHMASLTVNEQECGMDSACIIIAANELADESFEAVEWKPAASFNTMTDGYFGIVYELKSKKFNETLGVVIMGSLDKDTDYSEEEIISILSDNLGIKLNKEKEKTNDKQN